jgi:GT2 family glycosyltransferase
MTIPTNTATVSAAPRVAVILLNWNGRDDTMGCLKSLQALEYPNWEVLVVDNGSEDGSVEAIHQGYPDIFVIENGRNLGFTGGNNRGIEVALSRGAEFIMLLNNDTTVAPDLLLAFVRAAEEHLDAGVFGAKIYFLADPKRIWYAGTRWSADGLGFERVGDGVLDEGTDFHQVQDTEYACGCAMLFRASAARTVGLLDDRFFIFYEEADWCFRARKAGFRCLFVPEAKVWHRVSATFTGQRSIIQEYFMLRNQLLWAERHMTLRQRLGVGANTLNAIWPPWAVFRLLREFLQGRCSARQTYWRIRDRMKDWRAERHTPSIRTLRIAQWRALRDYLTRRFGDCPASIRALAGRKKPGEDE